MSGLMSRKSGDTLSLIPYQTQSLGLPDEQAVSRVLIADPCPDTVEITSLLLRLWGHEVRGVGTGGEILELAPTYRPDVILMEIALTDLDGCAVARSLRQQDLESRPLLAAVTGYGGEDNRQRCCAAGFDYHLVKPVEPDILHRLLSRRQRAGGEHD